MSKIIHDSYAETVSIRADAVDPRLRSLLDYYLEIHPKTRLPSREAFDPFQIPTAMPHLTLVDVERNPYRFKYRVMGSVVSRNMEFDATGRYLDEFFDNIQDQFPHTGRVEAVEKAMPIYRLGQSAVSFKNDFADLERVHLPLASDGETVDMVLSMFVYFAENQFSPA